MKEKTRSQPAEQITRRYAGIPRIGYCVGILACCGLLGGAILFEKGSLFRVFALLFVFLYVSLHVGRFRNIGISGWRLFACFVLSCVPAFVIGIVPYCASAPEGYYDTKRLDTTGKIIAAVCILLLISFFGFMYVTVFCL